MDWRLEGQTALVTGGTKGIGRAIADEFLRLGATTCIVARNADEVLTRVSAWRAENLPAYGIAADVMSAEGRQLIFEKLSEVGESLNILVNNVGTNIRKRTIDTSPDEYQHIV